MFLALVNSMQHDACITWRVGNGTVLLQNLVRFSEECAPSKIKFWSNFIDLYYRGTGKVIIEKSSGGRFFMEQELRFGLDLGRFGNF